MSSKATHSRISPDRHILALSCHGYGYSSFVRWCRWCVRGEIALRQHMRAPSNCSVVGHIPPPGRPGKVKLFLTLTRRNPQRGCTALRQRHVLKCSPLISRAHLLLGSMETERHRRIKSNLICQFFSKSSRCDVSNRRRRLRRPGLFVLLGKVCA